VAFGQNDNPREFEYTEGDTTYVMKRYYFCFYLRGPERSQDSATVAQLQEAHMAHLNKMGEAGAVIMAGPFADDGEKRGILIFDVPTMEEAEKWVSEDPMVKANRLTFEIHPWWGAKGTTLK
jgi:uncharacterized protein YciI